MKRYAMAALAVALVLGPARAWAQTGVRVIAPVTVGTNASSRLIVHLLDRGDRAVAAPTDFVVTVRGAEGLLSGADRQLFRRGAREIQFPLRARSPRSWMVQVVVQGLCSVSAPVTAVAGGPSGREVQTRAYRCSTTARLQGKPGPLGSSAAMRLASAGAGRPLSRAVTPALAFAPSASLPLPTRTQFTPASWMPMLPPPAKASEPTTARPDNAGNCDQDLADACALGGEPRVTLRPRTQLVTPNEYGHYKAQVTAHWCTGIKPTARESDLVVVLGREGGANATFGEIQPLTIKKGEKESKPAEVKTIDGAPTEPPTPLIVYATWKDEKKECHHTWSTISFAPANTPARLQLLLPGEEVRSVGAANVMVQVAFVDAQGSRTIPPHGQVTLEVVDQRGKATWLPFDVDRYSAPIDLPIHLDEYGFYRIWASYEDLPDRSGELGLKPLYEKLDLPEAYGELWLVFSWASLLYLAGGAMLGSYIVVGRRPGLWEFATRATLGLVAAGILFLFRGLDLLPAGLLDMVASRYGVRGSMAMPIVILLIGMLGSLLADQVLKRIPWVTGTPASHKERKPA